LLLTMGLLHLSMLPFNMISKLHHTFAWVVPHILFLLVQNLAWSTLALFWSKVDMIEFRACVPPTTKWSLCLYQCCESKCKWFNMFVYLNVNHSHLHTQDYTLCQAYFWLYSCMICVHIYFWNTLIILCFFWCKLWCNILIFIKTSSQWHWEVSYLLSMTFFFWFCGRMNK
jgi:hypothetical protein